MSITYQCDRCGEFVQSKKKLVHRTFHKSTAEALENPDLGVFWTGDLCPDCQAKIVEMTSRAVGEAAWEFLVNGKDVWTGTCGLFDPDGEGTEGPEGPGEVEEG